MKSIIQGALITIGILIVTSNQVVKALVCYDCNSEYDPRCGDPFDPYSLGEVNCSLQERLEHLPKLPPSLCRKTTQKVYGKVRVVRGCGFIQDPKDDKECVKRSGTHDVQAIYCSCTTDKCNGANIMFDSQHFIFIILLTTISIILISTFHL